ncbi:MAG: HAD family hydrolase [Bacilli bacterium]
MIRKRKSKVNYLVFDLDGTIIDSMLYIVLNFVHLFDLLSLPVPSLDQLVTCSGPTLKESFEKYFPGVDFNFLLTEYDDYARKNTVRYSALFPDEIRVLDSLVSAGYKLVLLTNKKREATDILLKHFELEKYFIRTFTIDDVEYPKPDYRCLLKIMDCFQAAPEEFFLIGDSLNDVLVGQKYHIPGGLCLWGLKKIPKLESTEEYYSFADIARSLVTNDQ